MGRWSLGSKLGLRQYRQKALRKVHGEIGHGEVERGLGKVVGLGSESANSSGVSVSELLNCEIV